MPLADERTKKKTLKTNKKQKTKYEKLKRCTHAGKKKRTPVILIVTKGVGWWTSF